MKKPLPKYSFGGKGRPSYGYSGMTPGGDPTLPTTSMLPDQLPQVAAPENAHTFTAKPTVGAGQAAGYAALAGSIGKAASAFGPEDPYKQGSDPTVQGINASVDTVVSAIPVVGQFYAAGKGISSGIKAGRNDARQNDDQSGAKAAAFGAGFVDPAGSWGDIAQDEGTGVISTEDAWGGRLLNLLMPGAGDAFLEGERDSYYAQQAIKNRTKTNVGGSSGLDGASYMRGNIMARKGGYMATGGAAPVEAELEGGETVESPEGDQMVTGPSHEQGGVPMTLNEGDYVWSDRIEYKGKSMAEWYELFKKNGAGEEQIEELRMLQERLAGRAPGEAGGEQMTLGGKPPKTKFGQWFDRAFGFERRRDMKSRQNAPMAASREVQRRDMEAQGLTPAERQANVDQEQAELMPVMQERLRQSARGEAPQYNPAEAYNKKVDESRAPKTESMGAVPRWKQIATEAAPYAIAGTGALAQIIAAAAAKNPYEGVALPKAHQAGFTPVSLNRVSDEADKAATARDYIAQLRAQERSGFGPSGSGRAQSLFNAKQMADAQTTMRTTAANADIDAKEKLGNMDARTRVDMFNAGQRQQVGLAGTDLQIGKNSFDSQRGMYIGDAVAGMARDTLGYMSARNHAKAIYGNSGVDNRNREYSLDQAYRKIMADNPNMSPNEAWKKAQEDQSSYFSQKKA